VVRVLLVGVAFPSLQLGELIVEDEALDHERAQRLRRPDAELRGL
jgi:hypothetical protein